jgi:hypothetical protein
MCSRNIIEARGETSRHSGASVRKCVCCVLCARMRALRQDEGCLNNIIETDNNVCSNHIEIKLKNE